MTPFFRALALLICLLAMLVLLAHVGQENIPVTLQWGTTSLTTTAAVASTFALMLAVLLFYLGRFVGWVGSLPQLVRNLATGHHAHTVWTTLTQTYTALYSKDAAAAAKAAKRLPPSHPMAGPLITLARLQTGQLTAAQAEASLNHPTLGPVVALYCTRNAAMQGNWPLVRHYAATGLILQPNHPALLTLHFKALLNTADPAAISFLPQVKPLLSRNTYQLLSTVVAAGITTPHAAALGHPWVKAFQKWLPTPDEVFPHEPTAQTSSR